MLSVGSIWSIWLTGNWRCPGGCSRFRPKCFRFDRRPRDTCCDVQRRGTPPEDALERELAAGLDLLDRLSTIDRMHARARVNSLSAAIDAIRLERPSIGRKDSESHSGRILEDQIRELEDLRIGLLFAVVFGEVQILVDSDGGLGPPGGLAEDNIVVDGVALAHDTLF